MSCAKIDPALHQERKPPWIKVRLPSNPVFFSTKALISDLRLHTVCESAQCPNRWECWSQGTATFMIAGDRCTRAYGFCAVTTAKPFALEEDEPQRVAEAVRRMKLKHVVVTAVARDDLKDGGANHFARTITAIREMDPKIVIEVLVPDFHAQDWCIQIVLDAAPDIYNHNMETVERLTPMVRSRAKYRTSLRVLKRAKELSPKVVKKRSGRGRSWKMFSSSMTDQLTRRQSGRDPAESMSLFTRKTAAKVNRSRPGYVIGSSAAANTSCYSTPTGSICRKKFRVL